MKPKLSSERHELDDGGIIEYPDAEGTIRRRDVHGNVEEIRRVSDSNWREWADLFDVTADDFEEWSTEEKTETIKVWKGERNSRKSKPQPYTVYFARICREYDNSILVEGESLNEVLSEVAHILEKEADDAQV